MCGLSVVVPASSWSWWLHLGRSLVQWAHALPHPCMEILGALAYMHPGYIIRKGLKLDNILVSDLDFPFQSRLVALAQACLL